MDVVWNADGALTVRDVTQLMAERNLAYTTLMTVMDRLHHKGHLQRELAGRAYSYRPSRSRAEHQAALMTELLHTSGDSAAALDHFVTGMTTRERTLLRQRLDAQTRKKAR